MRHHGITIGDAYPALCKQHERKFVMSDRTLFRVADAPIERASLLREPPAEHLSKLASVETFAARSLGPAMSRRPATLAKTLDKITPKRRKRQALRSGRGAGDCQYVMTVTAGLPYPIMLGKIKDN